MIQKINCDKVPVEEVTSSMHRKTIIGEKLMAAKMKFSDRFIVPAHHHIHEQIMQLIPGKCIFGLENT